MFNPSLRYTVIQLQIAVPSLTTRGRLIPRATHIQFAHTILKTMVDTFSHQDPPTKSGDNPPENFLHEGDLENGAPSTSTASTAITNPSAVIDANRDHQIPPKSTFTFTFRILRLRLLLVACPSSVLCHFLESLCAHPMEEIALTQPLPTNNTSSTTVASATSSEHVLPLLPLLWRSAVVRVVRCSHLCLAWSDPPLTDAATDDPSWGPSGSSSVHQEQQLSSPYPAYPVVRYLSLEQCAAPRLENGHQVGANAAQTVSGVGIEGGFLLPLSQMAPVVAEGTSSPAASSSPRSSIFQRLETISLAGSEGTRRAPELLGIAASRGLLPSLRTLNLSSTNIISLRGIAQCTSLESIKLDNCSVLENLRGLGPSASLQRVQAGMSLRSLHGLEHCFALRSLQLEAPFLVDFSTPQLPPPTKLEILEAMAADEDERNHLLRLANNDTEDAPKPLEGDSFRNSKTPLILVGGHYFCCFQLAHITIAGVFQLRDLVPFGAISTLESLSLERCQTLESVAGLGEKTLLKKLVIAYCPVFWSVAGLGGAKDEAEMGREGSGCNRTRPLTPSINTLRIHQCPALEGLFELGPMPQLASLSLTNNTGLVTLSGVERCPNLLELDVTGCTLLKSLAPLSREKHPKIFFIAISDHDAIGEQGGGIMDDADTTFLSERLHVANSN